MSLGFFAGFVVAAGVCAWATLAGIVNVLGWSSFATYALLAAAYGAFAFAFGGRRVGLTAPALTPK